MASSASTPNPNKRPRPDAGDEEAGDITMDVSSFSPSGDEVASYGDDSYFLKGLGDSCFMGVGDKGFICSAALSEDSKAKGVALVIPIQSGYEFSAIELRAIETSLWPTDLVTRALFPWGVMITSTTSALHGHKYQFLTRYNSAGTPYKVSIMF